MQGRWRAVRPQCGQVGPGAFGSAPSFQARSISTRQAIMSFPPRMLRMARGIIAALAASVAGPVNYRAAGLAQARAASGAPSPRPSPPSGGEGARRQRRRPVARPSAGGAGVAPSPAGRAASSAPSPRPSPPSGGEGAQAPPTARGRPAWRRRRRCRSLSRRAGAASGAPSPRPSPPSGGEGAQAPPTAPGRPAWRRPPPMSPPLPPGGRGLG